MAAVRLALLLVVLAAPARAAQEPYELFPYADELFHRLLADPRAAQTTLRYYRLEGYDTADVALGNTWGILRWRDVAGSGWDLQWNVEGMGYSRFRLSGAINEFQTIDFFANVPLEARRGPWSARVALFHESSHLGDDYIRRTGDTGYRYSIEGLKGVASVEPVRWLRLYGGGTVLLHQIPGDQGGSLQAGFELATPDLGCAEGRSCWVYLAQDFSPKARVKWNLDSNTELGFRMGVPHVVRALRVHANYYDGHSQYGQLFVRREHYFSLGVSFDF